MLHCQHMHFPLAPATIARISLIFALLASSSGADATGPVATSPSRFKKYENVTLGITIKFPANWQTQEGVEGVVVRFSSKGTGSANLSVEDLPVPISLKNYTESAIQSLKNAGFKTGTPQKTKLAGLPAYIVHSTKKEKGVKMALRQVWTIKGLQAYIMSFGTTSDEVKIYEKTFKTILRSFAFTTSTKAR